MKIFQNFNLKDFNSYRISAVCKTAYFPDTDEDIDILFNTSASPKILLGGGYNTILSKDYYNQDFVIFSGNYNKMKVIEDDRLHCEAGCDMRILSEFSLSNSLSGLEIFYDIPSSLGGAIVMNAGASGEDIKGLIEKVWFYNPSTSMFHVINQEEIGFEYRNSFFQRNPQMIVCRAQLKLKSTSCSFIKEKMDRLKQIRWEKQPRDFPNAGSVFKRPPNRFVGPMIDQLGLKGFTIGGAQISKKHSGFIINVNNASGTDILSIISIVKMKIKERFQIDLEVEQRVI